MLVRVCSTRMCFVKHSRTVDRQRLVTIYSTVGWVQPHNAMLLVRNVLDISRTDGFQRSALKRVCFSIKSAGRVQPSDVSVTGGKGGSRGPANACLHSGCSSQINMNMTAGTDTGACTQFINIADWQYKHCPLSPAAHTILPCSAKSLSALRATNVTVHATCVGAVEGRCSPEAM
jgi:hypothetical protein